MRIERVLMLLWISLFSSQVLGQAVNTKATDFKLPDASGWKISLSDYNDKVILMDVWATWCGPCRETMPHIQQLHEKYGDRGLVVIGVNIEGANPKVLRYIKEGGFTFTMLFDKNKALRRSYGLRGIPRTFVIDKNRIIRYAGHPKNLREDLIEELLEEGARDKRTGRIVAATGREEKKADSRMGKIDHEARLHYDKGLYYKKVGEFGRAANAFKDAIELAPDYFEAHQEYMTLMRRMGKERQLANDYEELIESHPKSATLHYMRGLSLAPVYIEDREKAFKKAIELRADFAEAYQELGAVYQAGGRQNEAEAAFEKARELKPDDKAKEKP